MNKNLVLIILLLPLFAICQKEIEVSEDYTTILVFPSEIEEPILGNEQEYLIKNTNNNSSVGRRTIRLGYIKLDKVEKNTNLTVFTKDGNSFEFFLKYAKTPSNLNHYISIDESQKNLLNSKGFQNEKTRNIIAENPVSYYSENVVTEEQNDNSLSKKSALSDLDLLYKTNKTEYINIKCQEVNNLPKKIYKTFDQSSNIKLTLKQVSYSKDELYFHLLLENKGGQTFDVDFINSKLSRRFKGVSTDQSIPLTPLVVYNRPIRVKGNTGHNFIIVFEKFSINNKKELQIDLAEKEGERDLLLRINNKLINNPVKL